MIEGGVNVAVWLEWPAPRVIGGPEEPFHAHNTVQNRPDRNQEEICSNR